MKRIVVLGSVILALAGCGGSGTVLIGDIAGLITDINGDPVRGARVFTGGKETTSNSGGAYVLRGISQGTHLVRAQIFRNSVDFNGQNVATVFSGDTARSLNIEVVRADQQAQMHGTVRDRFGLLVVGARVFALGNALSSSLAITDPNGRYSLHGLSAGITYSVSATARTFNSDIDAVLLAAGEDRAFDFVLGDQSNTTLGAPQNLSAIAWTTPSEVSRSPESSRAYEAIKRLLDPRRASRRANGRTTIDGNNVEVDLYWNAYPTQPAALLGFGIYRATIALGPSTAVDFLNDPQAAFFSDMSDSLRENLNYYYEITALNTSYPNTANSESAFSNRYGVRTLGDLYLLTNSASPLTFNWQAASGATSYIVFLFDEYPSIGVASIWDNSGSPTASTSLVYSGSALTPFKRYYYVVIGLANGGDSRTLSRIGDFVAN